MVKKRKSIGNKWYKDFVNFQAKRKEIEHLLKDKARRGSVYPSSENSTKQGYWATATEQDLAREVVNTLMEVKEHRKSVSEDLLKRKSVSESASAAEQNHLFRPQRHSVSEFETTNHRNAGVQKLSTAEEIRLHRASISAVLNSRSRQESIDSDVFRVEPKKKAKPVKPTNPDKPEKIEKADSKEKPEKGNKKVQKTDKKKEVKGKITKGKTTKGKGTKVANETKG